MGKWAEHERANMVLHWEILSIIDAIRDGVAKDITTSVERENANLDLSGASRAIYFQANLSLYVAGVRDAFIQELELP